MTKKKTPKTAPVVDTTLAPVEAPPRSEVILAGLHVWVEVDAALSFMTLEAVTRGMTREELADFSKRYNLRVEAMAAPTGDEVIEVCNRGEVAAVVPDRKEGGVAKTTAKSKK